MPFTLRVDGFEFGGLIPKRHTCEGEDVSPALEWSDPPPGTGSFALILDDPDAPAGAWNHWLLWDLPGDARSLAENSRTGTSGANDFGRPGYGGPCPPKGRGPHRYFFHLFAVEAASLELKAGAKRSALDRALRRFRVTEATYMGRYERR